jgi:endonuclease/exonuclease/phosphatase family metal-dependent hydrolase
MRLLSYNIHKGIGGRDRLYRLARVIAVIESENPDLIFLQEVVHNVRRSRFDDQSRLLAEYFRPAAHLYQRNVRLKEGGYGNLLLSRWPIREHHHVSLRLRSKKPRGAQIAVIETPEGRLRGVNFHLGLGERERHWQVRHLLAHPLFTESGVLPTLIAGDYNDWRNTLAANAFAEHGFAQITSPVSRFRSFPAYMAVGALDKAFCRGGVTIRSARIVRSTLSRRASDHLPLVIDFHLEPASEPARPTAEPATPRTR